MKSSHPMPKLIAHHTSSSTGARDGRWSHADAASMSFVQSTTGSGGWPMTVFLTPALKPFYGGTYFPPTSRWGRPGFSDLLGELARVWKTERDRVEGAATELFQRLQTVTATDGSERAESQLATADALDVAVDQFQKAFDRRRGGFGDAPKFPRPSELLFLLREHARRKQVERSSESPLLMATETLRAMALGGMTKLRLDALVAPTGSPAWPTDLVNGDHFLGASSTPAAVAGYPSITVPAGFAFGLPVGVSFIGRPWSEAKLIGFAYAYEQATKHRKPPTFAATANMK